MMRERRMAIVTCSHQGGSLRATDIHAIDEAIRHWPDGDVTVTIRPSKPNRSLRQNAFYWGPVLGAISDHTGYDVEEVHEMCKALFIPRDVVVADGNGEIVDHLVIGGSTARLSTSDMTDYIERVRRWAAETLGVVIPDPAPLGGN